VYCLLYCENRGKTALKRGQPAVNCFKTVILNRCFEKSTNKPEKNLKKQKSDNLKLFF